jgi:hypothetical protein
MGDGMCFARQSILRELKKQLELEIVGGDNLVETNSPGRPLRRSISDHSVSLLLLGFYLSLI